MGNVCGYREMAEDDLPDENLKPTTPFASYILHRRKIPDEQEINILSYNIFVRPPMISTYGDDYKNERLDEFAKVMGNYNIICLQEIFLPFSSRRKTLIELARKFGFKYSTESPKPNFFSKFFCDGGLLVLSKFPIMYTEFRKYPEGIGPDYIVEKGVIYTKIKVHDKILHLFSTHTQASYSSDPKYFLLHVEQFFCLRKFMIEMLKKNEYKKDDMTLIMGDFNVDSRDPLLYDTQTMLGLCPILKKFPKIVEKEKFHEYDVLLAILSCNFRDDVQELLLDHLKEHPATFGDFYIDSQNQIQPCDTVLTYEGGQTSSRRLDYIFKFSPRSRKKPQPDDQVEEETPNPKSELSVIKESARVEKFLVEGQKFTQLSDHYGVQVSLQYRNFEKKEDIFSNQFENESLSTPCI